MLRRSQLSSQLPGIASKKSLPMASILRLDRLTAKPRYAGFEDSDSAPPSPIATLKANLSPQLDTLQPHNNGLESFEQSQHQSESRQAPAMDEELADLSFWDSLLLQDSESPKGSASQPVTPSPGDAIRYRIDRIGRRYVGPEVFNFDSSEDDEAYTQFAPDTTSTQYGLGKRSAKLAFVAEQNSNLSMDGFLIESIERSPDVKPTKQDFIVPRSQSYPSSPSLHNLPTRKHETLDDTQGWWPVRRITGERSRPGSHEYRIEWLDYEGPSEWVSTEDCDCSDLVSDFRTLQRKELFADTGEDRKADVEKICRLAEVDQSQIDNVILPKHQRWKCNRRAPTGRFAPHGTRNSRIELLRLPTAAPPTRRNYARRPLGCLVDPIDDEAASSKDDVVWLYTIPKNPPKTYDGPKKPKKKQQYLRRNADQGMYRCDDELQGRGMQETRQEIDKAMGFAKYNTTQLKGERLLWRNFEMERAEMERRRNEDTQVEKSVVIKGATVREECHIDKACPGATTMSMQEVFREVEGMHRESQKKVRHRKARKKEREERKEMKARKAKMRTEKELQLNEAAGRADADKKRLVTHEKYRKKLQEELDETVRRAGKLSATKCEKKRNSRQTHANPAEMLKQPKPSSLNCHNRACSMSSSMSNSTRFWRACANEALAKRNELPRPVRSEFRATLSEHQAEALISGGWGFPSQH